MLLMHDFSFSFFSQSFCYCLYMLIFDNSDRHMLGKTVRLCAIKQPDLQNPLGTLFQHATELDKGDCAF